MIVQIINSPHWTAMTECLLRRDNREANRHNFTVSEINAALEKPVVRRLHRLIQFRNNHSAFTGKKELETVKSKTFGMEGTVIHTSEEYEFVSDKKH